MELQLLFATFASHRHRHHHLHSSKTIQIPETFCVDGGLYVASCKFCVDIEQNVKIERKTCGNIRKKHSWVS